MTLAPFVRIVAQGKGRARALTFAEAQEAMTEILEGRAAPEAVGGLLMVLRLRGEEAQEIAGFTAALRAHVSGALPTADLDWPSYAAGRSRGAPLYLLAARLVAQAGVRISMHGHNAYQNATLGPEDIRALLGPLVRYDPLSALCPEAFRLLDLRADLGLRSCINTVLRMWNPSGADATVQGVFHPSYRSLQAQAAEILGQQTLSIIKGGGGEFERHPSKDTVCFGLRAGAHIQQTAPAMLSETRRLHEVEAAVDAYKLWHGQSRDAFAEATVTGTAALALWTIDPTTTIAQAQVTAQDLWANRDAYERLTA
ncbi:MAG TPA: glycosyl transferase family 3 [Roseobacter sp.]|uniref:Glycosyl transferase family 3 N-terminal domain-containing protein n=1 Tax=marine sediment metagenome TaxID=412755 RepID=A0A0F9QZS2_9ZZZZ|nr:glycosyl transferase family 3 [Roseobacter sp.]|tara:strand:+ start:9943 stop:10878 length:936 start_codon:yes stop_codon:yes gene_type:complete